MKFFSFFTVVATISTAAYAAPVELYKRCEPAACLAALGPTIVGCAAAVVEGAVNIPVDLACAAGILAQVFNPPESCDGCVEQFADSVGETFSISKASLGITDVASVAEDEEEVSTSSSRVEVADASSFLDDEEESSIFGSASEDDDEEGGFFGSLFG